MSSEIPRKLDQTADRGMTLFALWLFGGDVTYAVLPLIVMAVLQGLVPGRIEDFILLKEWSFASIIFFGVAIRKFVHLKVRIQQTPHSTKLDTGLQLYIVLQVIAVLILVCVVLLELHVFPTTAAPLLKKAQILMFILGLSTNLISVAAENEVLMFDSGTEKRTKFWYLHRIKGAFHSATDLMDGTMLMLDHATSAPLSSTANNATEQRAYLRRVADTTDALNRLATLLTEVQAEYQKLLNVDETEPTAFLQRGPEEDTYPGKD